MHLSYGVHLNITYFSIHIVAIRNPEQHVRKALHHSSKQQ